MTITTKKRKTDKKVEVDVVNDLKRVCACEVCDNTLRADVEVRTQKKARKKTTTANEKRKKKKELNALVFSPTLLFISLFPRVMAPFFFFPLSFCMQDTHTQIRIITIKEEEEKN